MKRFIVIFLLPILMGAVPHALNYQGKLLDSSGVGVSDTMAITFRLFNVSSGGAALWEETIPDVEISKGLFSVELGSITPFPDSVDFSQQYWLEIVVGGETLTPREKLTSAPYALQANRVTYAIQSVYSSENATDRTGRIMLRPGANTTLTDRGDSIIIAIGCKDEAVTDFDLTISEASISVNRGESISNKVTAILLNPRATPTVSFSAVGLPIGVDISFSPVSCGPTCSSVMTINTTSSVSPGTYTVTVVGESADLVRTATFTLTITLPFGYSLAVNPISETIDPDEDITASVTATLLTGFVEELSFSASGLPSGAVASFSPTSCELSCSSTMSITTSPTTPPGTYPITITGMSASGVIRTTTYTLTIRPFDYTLTADPSTATIDPDENTTATITATWVSGYSEDVSLSASGLPENSSISFDPTSCIPNCTSTMNISTAPTTPPGTYSITITGTSTGGTIVTTTFDLTIRPFDYSIAVSPAVDSLAPGDGISSTVSTTLLTGYPQDVTFTALNLPADVSASFSPAACAPNCNSTMNITTSSSTPTGTFAITIKGTASGGLERTTSYTLEVGTVPSAINDLAASGSTGEITLTWTAPFNGGLPISSYNIYRDTSSPATTLLTSVDSPGYTDTGIGGTYYYRVTAVNDAGEGPWSNEVSATAEYATSCEEILNIGIGDTSGVYTIDPDGTGGGAPYNVYCDMDIDGGGWTLWAYKGSEFTGDAATPGIQNIGTCDATEVCNTNIIPISYTEVMARSFDDGTFCTWGGMSISSMKTEMQDTNGETSGSSAANTNMGSASGHCRVNDGPVQSFNTSYLWIEIHHGSWNPSNGTNFLFDSSSSRTPGSGSHGAYGFSNWAGHISCGGTDTEHTNYGLFYR